MLGLLGDTVIGLDVLTNPVEQSDTERARLVRLDTARGAPILHDLGDENDVRTLEFFLDETFCDVEAELAKLRRARLVRTILRLFLGVSNLGLSGYLLEEMTVRQQKTSPSGRIVRAEVSVQLVAEGGLAEVAQGIAADAVAALASPFVRR